MPIDRISAVRVETVLPFLADDGSPGLSLIAFDGRGFHFLFPKEAGSDSLRDIASQWDQMAGRPPQGH